MNMRLLYVNMTEFREAGTQIALAKKLVLKLIYVQFAGHLCVQTISNAEKFLTSPRYLTSVVNPLVKLGGA